MLLVMRLFCWCKCRCGAGSCAGNGATASSSADVAVAGGAQCEANVSLRLRSERPAGYPEADKYTVLNHLSCTISYLLYYHHYKVPLSLCQETI